MRKIDENTLLKYIFERQSLYLEVKSITLDNGQLSLTDLKQHQPQMSTGFQDMELDVLSI